MLLPIQRSAASRFVVSIFAIAYIFIGATFGCSTSKKKQSEKDTDVQDTDIRDTDVQLDIPTDFVIERVDGGWPGLEGVSIASSSSGQIAVAEVSGRYLYLLSLADGNIYSKKLIDRFVRWPSLVIDNQGYHHIVYWNSREEALYYASDRTGEWNKEEIHKTVDCVIKPNISVDTEGVVHIAFFDGRGYFEEGESKAYYGTNRSGEWVIESIPIVTNIHIHLACSADGECHVLYQDSEAMVVRITSIGEDGLWHTDTIDTRNITSEYANRAIAVDADGVIYAFFSTDEGVHFANNKNGDWEVEDLGPPYLASPFIAVDSKQHVHLVYEDFQGESGYLTHTIWSDGEQSASLVAAQYLANLSLCFDADDALHIAFQGVVGDPMDKVGGLVYQSSKSNFEPNLLDQGTMKGEFISMSVKDSTAVHLTYKNTLDENFWYASNRTGEWLTEEVDDRARTGEGSSVTYDVNGNPRIVYVADVKDVSGPPKLMFGTVSESGWQFEEIEIESYFTRLHAPCLLTDIDGNDVVVFQTWDENGGGLYLSSLLSAHRKAKDEWRLEEIYKVEGQAGYYISATQDSKGNLYAAFTDHMNAEIKVAVRSDDSGWSVEKAATYKDVARGVSIALNDDDAIFLSYLIETEGGGELILSSNQSGSWNHQVLDTLFELNVEGSSSIAVDKSGDIHISYVDYTNAGLLQHAMNYITNSGGEWKKKRVDSGGWIGEYNNLIVDENGTAHFSYFGVHALWYARFPAGHTDAQLIPETTDE